MTPCTQLSDRMPEVALGLAGWTAADERHMAGCADCRSEWAIVFTASRLGARLEPGDPERIAARATERIRHERAHARLRGRRVAVLAGLAAAAVLAAVVWAGRGGRGAAPGVPAPAPVATTPPAPVPSRDSQVQSSHAPKLAAVEIPLPELDSLPAEALDSMLQSLDEPLAGVGSYDLPDESGDRELEQVLAGTEG